MTTTSPCVRSEARHFGPKDLSKLVKALEVQLRDGLVEEVQDASELLLGRDGALKDGYRYTDAAYRQACNLACPGLLVSTLDLSGVDRNPDFPREEFSFELARRAFNATITARAGRFAGRQKVLRDVRTRRIEGFLGPKYQPIGNADILGQAVDAAAAMDRPAAFSWATLAGRLLVVRFAATQGLCTLPLGDDGGALTFRTGLHVANSEIGEQSSFRVAVPLIRDSDGASSLGPPLGGRRRHVGRDLSKRVGAAFAAAADASPTAEQAARWLNRLAELEVDFGDPRAEDRPARVAELVGRIRDAGAPQRVATRVVADAAAGDGLPTLDDDGVRTGYSLYSSLVAAARSLYVTGRELAEQAAHKLLLGKIRLG